MIYYNADDDSNKILIHFYKGISKNSLLIYMPDC
jgi:hypothetical protein